MLTDSEIKQQGFQALSHSLGLVDAERFITLLRREPFDYTQWRQGLLPNTTVRELSAMAMQEQED